jgi:hypothetical protein
MLLWQLYRLLEHLYNLVHSPGLSQENISCEEFEETGDLVFNALPEVTARYVRDNVSVNAIKTIEIKVVIQL